MEMLSDPIASVGLRHVIEDSISRLRQPREPSDRAAFALDRMRLFLDSALRGARMTQATWHSIETGDMSAIEVYSRMYEFFGNTYGEGLKDKIEDARETLYRLQQGQGVPDNEVESSSKFLEEILSKLKREGNYRRQSEPDSAKLG